MVSVATGRHVAALVSIAVAAGCSTTLKGDGEMSPADESASVHRLTEAVEVTPSAIGSREISGLIVLTTAEAMDSPADLPNDLAPEDLVTTDVAVQFSYQHRNSETRWGDHPEAVGSVLNLDLTLEAPLRAALVQSSSDGSRTLSSCPPGSVLDIDVETGMVRVDGQSSTFDQCGLVSAESSTLEIVIGWPEDPPDQMRADMGEREWAVSFGLSGEIRAACDATCDQVCNDVGSCVECVDDPDCNDDSKFCAASYTCVAKKPSGPEPECTVDSDCGNPDLWSCSGGECEPQACSGSPGECINTNTTDCEGTLLTGACPGPANIRCCAPCTPGQVKTGCVYLQNPYTTGQQVCASDGTWGACVAPPNCGEPCTDYAGKGVCAGDTGLTSCQLDGVRQCTCSSSGAWVSCGGCIL